MEVTPPVRTSGGRRMTTDMITVAAVQPLPKDYLMNPENVPYAIKLLADAARLGAGLACFPEGFPATGEDAISTAARDLDICVVAGFLPQEGDHLFNESIFIDGNGNVLGRHRKACSVPGVEPYACADENYDIVETRWGTVGILICIEGWGMPEGFYRMHKAGVDLIVNPNLIFRKKPQRRMSLLSRILDYKIPIVAPNNAVWSFKVFPDDPGVPAEGGGSLILVPPAFETKEDVIKFMREASSCEEWIVAEGGHGEEILLADINLRAAKSTQILWYNCFTGLV